MNPRRPDPADDNSADYIGCAYLLMGAVFFWIVIGLIITFLWPWG